jgi:hypothetical protein
LHHVNGVARILKVTCCWTISAWFGLAGNRAVAGVAPPPLQSADGNTYDFYVADQEQYDSNLYRLPSNYGNIATLVSPNASRSDYINTGSLGGDGQLALGRQLFTLNARADYNRFGHNTDLDNTSGYANLIWNWQVGSHLFGFLQADYTHALASFDETRTFGRDLTDSEHVFGKGRYQIGPHWAVYGGASGTNLTHSAQQAKFDNFRLKEGDAGIEYATSVDNTFGFQYRYADGTFPSSNLFTLNGFSFTPSFREDSLRFITKYSFSEKTQLDAFVGYYKRKFTETSLGAFSGAFGRVTLNWQPTEKTQLVFAGWQELHAYLISESNYFVSKGGSISPVWNVTEKIKLDFLLSYEDQAYISQSLNVLTLGALHAKVSTEQVDFNYSPRSSWIFSLALRHQRRSANQAFFQFDDQLATAGVLYKMH